MKNTSFHFLFIAALILGSCAHSKANSFYKILKQDPQSIWSVAISDKVKTTLGDYNSHKIIYIDGRALEYGGSVRDFNVQGLSFVAIEEGMQQRQCKKEIDYVKDPQTHNFVKDAQGDTVLMIVFLCPDGGVVRVKPKGDPTSKFRPMPHASKSLRYPHNAAYKNFDDEIIKVDNNGYAIPKWAKDLKIISKDKNIQDQWVEDWANDAHTNLF